MEKSFTKKKNVPVSDKEVFKEISLDIRQGQRGKDSPESGSLYSDYESGQQYEDKDLPSGYNSGEQYDTLSTGYMSGEAYELPETRPEIPEPTLASIDEVSHQSNEEIFTLGQNIYQDNSLLVQMEQLSSSSSSGSIPDKMTVERMAATEINGALENLALHKAKRAKKQVSYHISVPMDKSPLGNDGYREIPSDTDTTSCFDSDGTYIRSEAQSSDSGAALLSHSKRRGRDRKGARGGGGSRSVSLNRKLKKARNIIRSHEDFFRSHDNKYWMIARTACFWTSILSILICIGTAGVLIGLMPRTCDPEVEWWQGGVIVDISPTWSSGETSYLNLTDLINAVPRYNSLGIRAIKLRNLYRKTAPRNMSGETLVSDWFPCGDEMIHTRLELDMIRQLSEILHNNQMHLMVEIPTMEQLEPSGMMSLTLIQNVTRAIKTWAELGVDAIGLVGMELFARDPYIATTAELWKVNFQKYGTSPNRKVLSVSYLLPINLEKSHTATDVVSEDSSTFAQNSYQSIYDSIASFELLDATISLESSYSGIEASEGEDDHEGDLSRLIENIARWDHAPSQPWILWHVELGHAFHVSQDHVAEMTFHMMLPGTISLQMEDLNSDYQKQLLGKLSDIRSAAVPIFMNGNFKTCHSHCDGDPEKVDNYKVHQLLEHDLVMLERNFNRRNRYMVIANLGSSNVSLTPVSSLYSGGEVILDTSHLESEPTFVKFKDANLQSQQAIVIKFPK